MGHATPRMLAWLAVMAALPLPGAAAFGSADLEAVARGTYASILAMVEPRTGLPHDHFDASLFDILPQFAVVRSPLYVHSDSSMGASLEGGRCRAEECVATGGYGLRLNYQTPPGAWGASYNMDAPGFDVSRAAFLEAWVKGAQGGERFEFVLWSNCQGDFPGRPESALISAGPVWERRRIPLSDFQPFKKVDLSALCRLSIGFNNSIHPGGTIYLDQIAFVDADGSRIPVPVDEPTNVSNIGLYIASVLGALELGWEQHAGVVERLGATLSSLEAFQKWHGFPQTHNHVVSLLPDCGDRCISTVDFANLAAGLILLRQRVPELSARASALLENMEWDWLYDEKRGLPYGCRYPDRGPSERHYDWLVADSRLAHFIGIGASKMPPASWLNLNRAREPQRCAGLWHFEPGWDGGGLFMAFLPAIFLDEANTELGNSARNFVEDQMCFARALGAPAWGWSATALPPFGEQYYGYGDLRDDILVPHASILAAEVVGTDQLNENLRALAALGAREPATDGVQKLDFGFRASVRWAEREAASTYLALDQAMAFLSLVNLGTDGGIRRLFCRDPVARTATSLIPDYAGTRPACVPPVTSVTASTEVPR